MKSTPRQNWTIGQTVKVGFMSLVVKAQLAATGDGLPGAFILANATGTKLYKSVPFNGVEALSLFEARELLAENAWRSKQAADRLISQSQSSAAAVVAINDLIFGAVAA